MNKKSMSRIWADLDDEEIAIAYQALARCRIGGVHVEPIVNGSTRSSGDVTIKKKNASNGGGLSVTNTILKTVYELYNKNGHKPVKPSEVKEALPGLKENSIGSCMSRMQTKQFQRLARPALGVYSPGPKFPEELK